MLDDNIDSVGWPGCDEIDIMESIGKEPLTVHGSNHGPGFVGGDGIEAPYKLSGYRRFADDFPIFAVEWEPNPIRLYVDRDLYVTRTPADLRKDWRWVFDHPFSWCSTLLWAEIGRGIRILTRFFLKQMLVDYVRV